jgi:hypothetical protein
VTHRSFSRSFKLCVLAAAFATATAAPVAANPNGYGLGFVFGEPTGINAKMWHGHDTAFIGGLAWSFVEDGATTVYGDYIWHNYSLLNVQTGALPLYFGAGARLQLENDARFGIRTVVGLNYQFRNAPFDAFMEMVPLFDITPDADLKLNAALGFRYFFR